MGNPEVRLRAEEIILLASLFGNQGSIPGISDPFQGWLTQDIRKALARAKLRLIDRGYIQEQDLKVAKPPLLVVNALLKARGLLSICSAIHRRTFYRGPDFFLDMTHDGHQYLFKPTKRPQLEKAIQHLFSLNNASQAPFEFHCLESVLEEARSLITRGGRSLCYSFLSEQGLSPEVSESLSVALLKPETNAVVLSLEKREQTWHSKSLAFLASEVGLWELRNRFINSQCLGVDFIPAQAPSLLQKAQLLAQDFLESA